MFPTRARAESFCGRFGLKMPVLLAPMAGACPPSLSIAVMNAGSLGACGALLMQPDEIVAWAEEVRVKGNGPYQLNLRFPILRRHVTRRTKIVSARFSNAPDRQFQRTRRWQAAGFCRPMRSFAGDQAADCFLSDGPLSACFCQAAQASRRDLVCEHLDGNGGSRRRGCRSRCCGRPRYGGRRTSRLFQCGGSRAPAGRFVRVTAWRCRCGQNPSRCHGWHRRRSRSCRRSPPWRQCGADRDRAAATPEAELHPAWSDAFSRAAPEDTMVSRVFSSAQAQHRH